MAISSFCPLSVAPTITRMHCFSSSMRALIDADPEIDVALGRGAPLPALRLNPPDLFQPGDRGGRKPRRGAPQERRQGFPEVAGGNALQIQPWQKVFQALGAAQIARQDRRREADGAVLFPVPHTGLAHAHRADPGLDEAFRQISIADNPAAAGASTSAVWLPKNTETSASTAWANNSRAPACRTSVNGSF